jgi:hypothetical protein
MPVVFVIARDSKLRVAVRAELRERGIEALGMESPDEAGRAMAAGEMPSVMVVEGLPEFTADAAMQQLMKRVPAVVVASRIDKISLAGDSSLPAERAAPDQYSRKANRETDRETSRETMRTTQASATLRGKILYRPISVGQIVTQVLEFLNQGHAA